MKKHFLLLLFAVCGFIPSYAQNYDSRFRTYSHGSYEPKDSIWFNDVPYTKAQFYSLVRQKKLKVQQGNRYGDSVYFKGTWFDPDEYTEKYYFETAMMPGLEFEYYKPFRSDSVGSWTGLSVEYLFYGKVHNDDFNGPGHVRFYGKLGILNSNKANTSIMLSYSLGLTLSWEKHPKRPFLVPNFGLEAGGFSQKQLGTIYFFTPMGGIQFVAIQNIFAGVYAGYRYPLRNFENMRGFVATASIDFSLWK